jgi:hypothetical protein
VRTAIDDLEVGEHVAEPEQRPGAGPGAGCGKGATAQVRGDESGPLRVNDVGVNLDTGEGILDAFRDRRACRWRWRAIRVW